MNKEIRLLQITKKYKSQRYLGNIDRQEMSTFLSIAVSCLGRSTPNLSSILQASRAAWTVASFFFPVKVDNYVIIYQRNVIQ